MKTSYQLEQQIKQVLKKVKPSTPICGHFDTRRILYELALTVEWGDIEFERIDFLSKRLDISRKLFVAYYDNGRKVLDSEIIDNDWLELVIAVLLKAALLSWDGVSAKITLKRFNVLFKSLDLVKPDWLQPEMYLGKEMSIVWKASRQVFDHVKGDLEVTPVPDKNIEGQNSQFYKVLPLTVLFYEGPIARAYLATIKSLGFKPQKIIELVALKDVSTKKVVGKWLPQGIRTIYAGSIQRNKIHYWPKQLSKSHSKFVNSIINEVQKKFGFVKATIEDANSLLPLSKYSDCVESLLIEGLDDKNLQQYLREEPPKAILYTGGGIMPAELLGLQHLKFLHIHPGYLPDIRGADCALWSLLLTGHTSATCFYMSEGIDIGNIIAPVWLPSLFFDTDVSNIDQKLIYRSIYGFLDPWIRSFVLREIINNNSDYETLHSSPQSEEDGTTFHFMHERLQKAAFFKITGYELE